MSIKHLDEAAGAARSMEIGDGSRMTIESKVVDSRAETLSACNGVTPGYPARVPDANQMDTAELARLVRAKWRGFLADTGPYVAELWERFKHLAKGDTILGCRTTKEFLERHLGRTDRPVRYMLAGGNPACKRNKKLSVVASRNGMGDFPETDGPDMVARRSEEPLLSWEASIEATQPKAMGTYSPSEKIKDMCEHLLATTGPVVLAKFNGLSQDQRGAALCAYVAGLASLVGVECEETGYYALVRSGVVVCPADASGIGQETRHLAAAA